MPIAVKTVMALPSIIPALTNSGINPKAARPDLWDRYTSTQTTVTLDARSLQKDEPEVYGKYATKTAGARKFLLK